MAHQDDVHRKAQEGRREIITTPLANEAECRTFHGIDCQVQGCAGYVPRRDTWRPTDQ